LTPQGTRFDGLGGITNEHRLGARGETLAKLRAWICARWQAAVRLEAGADERDAGTSWRRPNAAHEGFTTGS
jgi:hypothetical protein